MRAITPPQLVISDTFKSKDEEEAGEATFQMDEVSVGCACPPLMAEMPYYCLYFCNTSITVYIRIMPEVLYFYTPAICIAFTFLGHCCSTWKCFKNRVHSGSPCFILLVYYLLILFSNHILGINCTKQP